MGGPDVDVDVDCPVVDDVGGVDNIGSSNAIANDGGGCNDSAVAVISSCSSKKSKSSF